MATKDIKMSSRNNEMRDQDVVVATISFNQPKGTTLVSGDTYVCGTIPAGSLVKSVDMIVTEAFDGTTPKFNVGVTGSATLYKTDLAGTAGVTAGAAGTGVYYTENTDIIVTPTLVSATKGNLLVVVSVIMPGKRTGSYSA